MTTSDRAAALVTWWVTVYTRRLPREAAQRRQAELASDLWEQRAHARQAGAPAPLVALAILRRASAGIPADLRWRRDRLAAARGTPHQPRRRPVRAARRPTIVRAWWLVLGALLGVSSILWSTGYAFLDWQFDATASRTSIWPALWNVLITLPVSAGGVLLVVGLASRPRARIPGDVLIAIGTLPFVDVLGLELPAFGAVLVALVPMAVVTMATLDAAEARSLGQRGTPRGASRRLLALATVLLAAVAVTGARIAVDQSVTSGRVVVALMYATAAIVLLAAVLRRRDAQPRRVRHHTTR
jgi:hypothetical protein